MKNAPIRIKINGHKQAISLSTVEIKILLLRARLSVTDLAARIGRSREAVSKTINNSDYFPEVHKEVEAELERIVAELGTAPKSQRRAS